MHSNVYQITPKPLQREDYMDAVGIPEENLYEFADRGEDVMEEDEETEMQALDNLLQGVFRREGRTLIYLGADEFVKEWRQAILKEACLLNDESFKSGMTAHHLKELADRTHLRTATRIYGYAGDEWADPFGEFITHVYANNKPGDRYYIGGIVDFHY